MSRLVTNAIRSTAASSDAMTIDSAGKPSFPNGGVGKILQVVQTVKTDAFSHNSTSLADITGLTATITPSSNSNKIFVSANLYFSIGTSGGSTTIMCNLVRGSTNIAQPNHGSANHQASLFSWSSGAYMQQRLSLIHI